ncbi:MAG: hypothetical protein Q8M16_08725 [Pirellulaceae bacterium]|nr:hypothetical protein [Pirellulaceae bacterium]
MNRFPLPLVPWEEFFYYKHRPSHPATFFAFFEFSQPLQRDIAEEALRIVCIKHPLMRAIVEQRGRKLFWNPANPPVLQWCDSPFHIDDLDHGNLDIGSEPGLKVWAFAGDPPSVPESKPASIQVVIHHVAFDGLGVLQILLDWINCYQKLQAAAPIGTANNPIEELPIPPRCRPTLSWTESFRLLPGQWKSLRASFQLLGRQAIPLGLGEPLTDATPRKPHVVRFQLDSETTLRLKKYSAAQLASLNSILIRDLLMTIDQWQTTLPQTPAGTHLRIMIPINERGIEHRHSAACNHCSMINVERTREEVRNPKELLASVEQEMGVIQKWKLSLNFWRALSIFRWLPNGLRRVQTSQVAATASLTNLGRLRLTSNIATSIADPPNSTNQLRLTNFEIAAPLMHGTMAAFAVAYFQNELRVSVQYDPHHLTIQQAESLMQLFRSALLANVDSNSFAKHS